MSKGKGQPPRFEEAVEQLESILERIESGEIGLEESLAEYERGMKLIQHCRAILGRAEQRIRELTPAETAEGDPSGGASESEQDAELDSDDGILTDDSRRDDAGR